jgi:ATP phosphoribosyltransferase
MRARAAARTVLTRIAAEEDARTTREVRTALDPDRRIEAKALADRFGAALPLGDHGHEIVLRCRAENVFGLVDALLAAGARDVTVRALAYVFQTSNPLTERLFKRISSE